jgi:hypothetical protein
MRATSGLRRSRTVHAVDYFILCHSGDEAKAKGKKAAPLTQTFTNQ